MFLYRAEGHSYLTKTYTCGVSGMRNISLRLYLRMTIDSLLTRRNRIDTFCKQR